MMPMTTSDAPALTDEKIRKVYIKDGQRKMTTDSGYMYTPAHHARSLFGKMRGGRYSMIQEDARKET
jgi:hypothetical protein